MIDDIDRRIIRTWQTDPTLTRRALAARLQIGAVTLNRRIEALREARVFGGRRAVVDWSKFGFGIQVFLRVTLDKTAPNAWDRFLSAARAIDEIVVVETLLGRVDVRMDVRARDLAHYQEIYVGKILGLPHILDIESLVLVSEVKNSPHLPL